MAGREFLDQRTSSMSIPIGRKAVSYAWIRHILRLHCFAGVDVLWHAAKAICANLVHGLNYHTHGRGWPMHRSTRGNHGLQTFVSNHPQWHMNISCHFSDKD